MTKRIAPAAGSSGASRGATANAVVFEPRIQDCSIRATARQTWIDRPDIGAWITWTTWQAASPNLADLVEVERKYRIYRDTAIGLTRRGLGNAAAKEFVAFLQFAEGAATFRKWGAIAASR